MLRLSLVLVALALLCCPASAQQPPSPGPFATGNDNHWDSAVNPFIPGDEHGAVGRTYVVLSANLEMTFINRPIQNGYNPLPSGMPVPDSQFWQPLPSSSVIVPNGTTPPTGTVQVTPNSDFRVYYDPYSPCGDGAGRWIVVGMGNLTYSDQTTAAAVLLAISQQEDPNPADSGVSWTQFAIASTAPANTGSDITAVGDFPRAGFNTNWIGVTALKFFKGSTGSYSVPLLFLFARQPSECTGTAGIPVKPSTLPTSGGGACTGSSGGSSTAWYCNDSSIQGACPALSYHTGSDPDGSNFFLVRSVSGSTGTIDLYEISGTVNSPNYGGIYSQVSLQNQPGPGGNWTWQSEAFPNLGQADSTTLKIAPGPDDDRFESCVVRNSTLWASQTIGLPATNADSTAVQWWSIGLDANKGKIYDVERIGGDGAYGGSVWDTMDSAIAVNSAGDVLVGFEGVPNINSTSYGYLSALFAFKSHSGCLGYQNYLYAGGLGPYYPSGDANGNPVRTGDYSQTVVDPNDDTTFWTSEGWAGESGAPGNGYGWLQAWGFVSPSTPSGPTFLNLTPKETECPSSPCTVTFTAPPNSQAGDVFIATITTAIPSTLTQLSSIPAGWNYLTYQNLGTTYMKTVDANWCDLRTYEWSLVHTYTGSNDSGSYTFQFPRHTLSCNGVILSNELGGELTAYRGACQNFETTKGTQILDLQGFPQSTYSKTITVGPFTPPDPSSNPGIPYDNANLLNYLYGSAEADDSGGDCSNMSDPISGTPALSTRANDSGCNGYAPAILGDYSPTNHGQSYGSYSSEDAYSGIKSGLELLLPPY